MSKLNFAIEPSQTRDIGGLPSRWLVVVAIVLIPFLAVFLAP